MDWEASADFGLPQILSVIGVRTNPGATALTRIPFDAYVAAADNVRPMTPAFAAAIAS